MRSTGQKNDPDFETLATRSTLREGTTAPLYRQPMRWIAIILGLAILGLGMFFVVLSVLLMNRSSNTGLMAIGIFGVLVGLDSLWMIYRARRRKEPARWRFLDH